MKYKISLDVGGTSIKIGVFNYRGKLIKKYNVKTNISLNDKKSVLNQIIEIIKKEFEQFDISHIGIGVPGPVSNGVLLGAYNLHMNKVNLLHLIKHEFPECTVTIMNDANAACLGEVRRGSGIGYKNVCLVTIGTGIGCVVVIDGKVLEGVNGAAGELGHICVEHHNGVLCKCGKMGCLEKYASASAIKSYAKELYEKYNIVDHKYEVISLFEDYLLGFKPSIEVINRSLYYLAIGLSTIANIVNPELIILGGGVSKAENVVLETVKFYFKQFVFKNSANTPIVIAKLHNDAGIYGLSEI